MAALNKAMETRRVQAAFKAELKSGKYNDDLLGTIVKAQQEEMLARMYVVKFIESVPGIGKVKAAAIMSGIGIARNRRMQGLGNQQRQALVFELNVALRGSREADRP